MISKNKEGRVDNIIKILENIYQSIYKVFVLRFFKFHKKNNEIIFIPSQIPQLRHHYKFVRDS